MNATKAVMKSIDIGRGRMGGAALDDDLLAAALAFVASVAAGPTAIPKPDR